MRQPRRNSCRPFGTSDASSSRTTGSRPWLHLVVPPGLNHIPGNHVDYVLPMFSLIKILHGVAQRGERAKESPIPITPFQGDRKRTAAPSGISVHQRLPPMLEFSPWRFVFLHERVVCGRRGPDAHPCGRCGCDQDGWWPRCRDGENGSPLSRPAGRRALL